MNNKSTGCTCGCCAGTSVQTPEGENNLPGLPAVAYRTGTLVNLQGIHAGPAIQRGLPGPELPQDSR